MSSCLRGKCRHEVCMMPNFMRTVAAIPAVALLAGCAAGLLVPAVPSGVAYALMAIAMVGAVAAWHAGRPSWLVSCVVAGFAAGSALLASDAWRQARQSSLRLVFDELARAQRAEAEAAHRFVPEDPSAFAFIEGLLRSDASPGAAGWMSRGRLRGCRPDQRSKVAPSA